MDRTLYTPLEFYENYAKAAHDESAKALFDKLVKESRVPIEENRQTVKKYNELLKKIDNLKRKLSALNVLKIIMIILAVCGVAFPFLTILSDTAAVGMKIGFSIGGAILCASMLLIVFLKLNKTIGGFFDVLEEKQKKSRELLKLAWEQMEPLNALFEDDMTFKLIEKTIPEISFDKQFTPGREAELQHNYAYEGAPRPTTSITNTVSGALEGNPFLFERSLTQSQGTKIYHGQLLIRWVVYVRDKNGTRAVTRTQMLHASVAKPIPVYSTNTHLNYGSQAAPDLSFSRNASGTEALSKKQIDRKVKRGRKALEKKAARELKGGGDFTEMSNSEFDVLFGAVDRNHEQQFRLIFTPLAQVEMTKLMKSKGGFGDDFAFIKKGKHNVIRSRHAENWIMETDAKRYYSYDFDACRRNFININNSYFKSIYFDFAPLLAIPAYHDEPVNSMKTPSDTYHFTAKEYETLANRIGEDKFAPEGAATRCILKAAPTGRDECSDRVAVTAHAFAVARRVDFVPTLGGDGRIHPVPVSWDEYIPVSKTTHMYVASLDMSETKFKKSISSYAFINPALSACYHGLFAHIDCNEGELPTISEMVKKLNELRQKENTKTGQPNDTEAAPTEDKA